MEGSLPGAGNFILAMCLHWHTVWQRWTLPHETEPGRRHDQAPHPLSSYQQQTIRFWVSSCHAFIYFYGQSELLLENSCIDRAPTRCFKFNMVTMLAQAPAAGERLSSNPAPDRCSPVYGVLPWELATRRLYAGQRPRDLSVRPCMSSDSPVQHHRQPPRLHGTMNQRRLIFELHCDNLQEPQRGVMVSQAHLSLFFPATMVPSSAQPVTARKVVSASARFSRGSLWRGVGSRFYMFATSHRV